jgi:Leucine-rich repeat (LRR) protein
MLRSMHLDHELLALPDLAVLDISANLAEQLPPSVLLLTGLRELHAGMNRLGLANHDFGTMQALQVLVLASNKLLGLHDSVWGLVGLRRLDLGHNNLTDLPQAVSSLTALTVRRGWRARTRVCLCVGGGVLEQGHGVGCSCRCAETLVRGLPCGCGRAGAPTLAAPATAVAAVCLPQYLNVCHNFLTALPAGVGCLVGLVELDVSLNTDMRELPAGLGALSCLTRLVASHMRLKQLPM